MEDKKIADMVDDRRMERIIIWSAIGAAVTTVCVYALGYRTGALAAANSVQQEITIKLVEESTTDNTVTFSQPKES